MPITAKDIAKHLDLSQPTVSRILNGDTKHRISEETRRRVLEAAKHLRYQPNAVARALRRGHTNIIGMYSNHHYDTRNDFQGTVIGVLQRSCEQRGLDLLLHSSLQGSSAEAMLAKLRDGRADGLILHSTGDDPLVDILESSHLPIVAIADPLPDLTSVTCDDVDGMRQAIGYLWDRGYRSYAYVCPERQLNSVERRRETFEIELERRGVPREDRAIRRINWENVGNLTELLRATGKRTAVCCWNDRTAYRLLERCLQEGIRVPDEIAVVGFDGFLAEKIPAMKLVTIQCPWEQVVRRAFDELVDMIEHDDVQASLERAANPRQIVLPVHLVEGDTA